MAKNISILGASYSDVPAITLPTTQGGTASFTDVTDTTATNDDVVEGKIFYSASGVRTTGTGISRSQVQTLVEENKVKHVYGIDGYQETGDPAEVCSLYFDGTGALYDPETNTTPTEEYLEKLGKIFSDGKQKYALYEGTYIPLELNEVSDSDSDSVIFTSNGQTVFRLTVGSTNITVTNPNNMQSPFVLYENGLAPIPNFEPELIETIYYDQDTKVYSLNGEEKVYWDTDKIESFASAVMPYSDGNNRFGYATVNGTFSIATGPQNNPIVAFIDDIEKEGYLCALIVNQDSSVKIINPSGTLPSSPLEIFTASISAVVENDQSNIASGLYSHSEGARTVAKSLFSHAEGLKTTAFGSAAHAEGSTTTASGSSSHAEGFTTTASGSSSHAEGLQTTASNEYTHAEGCSTIASGNSSHAEGYSTTASGIQSHAEGYFTIASGNSSHAEGSTSTASGVASHSEGNYTVAASRAQHVFGEYNVQDAASNPDQRGTYVEIVGNGSDGSPSNARTLDWSGNERLAGNITLGAGTSKEIILTAENLWTIMERCGLISHDE